jgi:hypothetical protein
MASNKKVDALDRSNKRVLEVLDLSEDVPHGEMVSDL